MSSGDDARPLHPPRRQILAVIAAGLLTLLVVRYLLTDDWLVAGGLAFAAAQLAAELFAPRGDDGPPSGSTPAEIRPNTR